MKKQLLTLVAMALLTSSACVAQDQQRGGRGQRGDMTERMKTELGLSDEQVAQLKEVYSQMRPSQQGERPSREEIQKKREAAFRAASFVFSNGKFAMRLFCYDRKERESHENK